MNKQIINYLFHCAAVLTIQILALNHINISGFINPYIYPVLILLLPLQTPKYQLLLIAFILGLTVDIFQETPGMHAAALVFIAFLRPYLFKVLNPKEQEADELMNIAYHGITWFVIYVGLFTFIHHLVYFRIEKGNFGAYHYTLLKTILSSLFSILCIFIYLYLSTNSRSVNKYN